MEQVSSILGTENPSVRGNGGVVHMLNDDLPNLNVMRVMDLDVFSQERSHRGPVDGGADDEKEEPIGCSQGGAVDASYTQAGLAESYLCAGSTFVTDHRNGDDLTAILPWAAAHENIDY